MHISVNAWDRKDLGKMNDLEIINQTKKIRLCHSIQHQATYLHHFTLNLLKLTGRCVAKPEPSAFTLPDPRVPETLLHTSSYLTHPPKFILELSPSPPINYFIKRRFPSPLTLLHRRPPNTPKRLSSHISYTLFLK